MFSVIAYCVSLAFAGVLMANGWMRTGVAIISLNVIGTLGAIFVIATGGDMP